MLQLTRLSLVLFTYVFALAVTAYAQGGLNETLTKLYMEEMNLASKLILPTEVPMRALNLSGGELYGGAEDSDAVIDAYEEDAEVHYDNWEDCHDKQVTSNGCEFVDLITYWFPVATYEIGNFSETRYATKDMYEDYNEGSGDDSFEDTHYENAQDYAVEALERVGASSPTKVNPNVDQIPSALRSLHAKIAGTSHVSYHSVATLAQIAYSHIFSFSELSGYSSRLVWGTALEHYIEHYFDIYCNLFHGAFPTTWERFSDITPMAPPAYDNAWSLEHFAMQMDLLQDDPASCLMLNAQLPLTQTPGNLTDLAEEIGGEGWLTSMVLPFFKTCTPNWGRIKPVTTYSQDVMSPAALAGIMTYKAADTRFMDDGPIAGHLIGAVDKLQWIYPEGDVLNSECVPAGFTLPNMFMNQSGSLGRVPEHPGVVAVTHWKFYAMCAEENPLCE